MTPPSLSVIIPTLNEAAVVECAIRSAIEQGANEVVAADGGSSDATRSVALQAGARLATVSIPQRARQMNAGAVSVSGDILVFLHADTVFEPGALDALRRAAADTQIVGGGFRRRYQARSLLLAASCRVGNTRARHLGWFFGDQAIWVRRDIFDKLGGFPEEHLFEDLDFTRHLRRLGRTHLVSPGVETSARRFQDGALIRILADIFLTMRHIQRESMR